jgi:hypothetical protein
MTLQQEPEPIIRRVVSSKGWGYLVDITTGEIVADLGWVNQTGSDRALRGSDAAEQIIRGGNASSD